MQKSIIPLPLIRFFDDSPIDYPEWRKVLPHNAKCEPVTVTQIDPRELMRLQTIFEVINGNRTGLTFNLYTSNGLYIRSEDDYILVCAPFKVTAFDSKERILNSYKQHWDRG
jgi:hypothetical protein